MNDLDQAITLFVNRAAHYSAGFDQTVVFLSSSDLVKGGAVVAAVWAAWFSDGAASLHRRTMLLGAIVGSLAGLFVARVLAYVAPMRVRPVLDSALHFRPPIGLPAQTNWTEWSSFPSDHAALFLALAWGIWCVSRRFGIGVFLYVLFVICIPRVYIGIHYTSDIFAGGLLGVASAALFQTKLARRWLLSPLLSWSERQPLLFYLMFSLLAFQIATLFWDIRVAMSLFGLSV